MAKVNPDLVVRDENGEIYTVRYDAVNAMLLNEFLKEHRKNEEQEATITQQRKDFEAALAFSIICRHALTQQVGTIYDLIIHADTFATAKSACNSLKVNQL